MVTFDIFKKVITLLKDSNLDYRIFGGFAFDGLRGHITREHKDIDIYLDAGELEKITKLFKQIGSDLIKKEKMYFIKSPDLRVGICLTTKEGESVFAHGNYTLVSTPSIMWKDNIVSIDGLAFNCAPNELLVFDSQYSTHADDKLLSSQIKCDAELFGQIKVI